MRRTWKITWISLASLAGLIVIAVAALSVLLFSADNLAAVVRNQLNRQDKVEFTLDQADLVFFSTFPEVSLHLKNFAMRSRTSSDTILASEDIYAALNLKAFLNKRELRIRKVSVETAYADLSRLVGQPAGKDTSSAPLELPFGLIDASSVSMKDIRIRYADENGLCAEVQDLKLNARLRSEGNRIEGLVKIVSPNTFLAVRDTVFCDRLAVNFALPFTADLSAMDVNLNWANLCVEAFTIGLNGNVNLKENGDIGTDLQLSLSDWNIADLKAMVPAPFAHLVEDISAEGLFSLEAAARGTLSDSLRPVLDGTLSLSSLAVQAPFLPAALKDGNMKVQFASDLNGNGSTDLNISSLSVSSGKNRVSLSGTVRDLLKNPRFDLRLNSGLELAELLPFLPDSLQIEAEGRADLDLKWKGNMNQLRKRQFDRMTLSGQLALQDLDLICQDSILVISPEMELGVSLNGGHGYGNSKYSDYGKYFTSLGGLTLSIGSLDVSVGKSLNGVLTNSSLRFGLDRIPTGPELPRFFCDFDLGNLSLVSDTLKASVTAPKGSLAFLPSVRKGGQGRILCDYSSESLSAQMGAALTADTKRIALKASLDRDTTAKDFLARWNPVADIDFENGTLKMRQFSDPIEIPAIRIDFADNAIHMAQSSFVMGNSDFKLSGSITRLQEFLEKKGLLRADLNFISDYTDVDQLLSYFSGMGTDPEAEVAEAVAESEEEAEGDPFMVPKGIDLNLDTKIRKASAFGNLIENVAGGVTVKDGVAVLKQLGFTSDAAKMQLTAMYKSPRRNHLFTGIDFHLIDIEIDRLVDMIPEVDSILPMLKSFSGQAEFHMTVETALNSKYELKKSTLLGAAAIEGRNLVVLDSKTFDEIADMLLFKKSARNVIDSLMVDMTVFRNEVDVYPFVVSMDNYKLILSGRHNLDMSFNYHFDCVSPIRLGLDLNGKPGKLKFKLTPTRYKNLFIPERRNDVQERTFQLMQKINSSLKENVTVESGR